MSWLKKKKHLNVDVWKKGFVFAKVRIFERFDIQSKKKQP
jgi:hypothetical protein